MKHFATHQQRILGQLSAVVLPAALKFLNIRISHYDRSSDPARPEYDQHVIYVFWHEYIGVVLPRWGRTPLTILVSQHRDGEWVNQTAEFLRLRIVRGSTSRGGSSAIRQLKRHSKTSSLVLTPDGPRGPRREMAMGPVYLASLLKMPIVPLAVGMNNPWRLKTWDQFAIPKPFSRTRMIFGPKIHVPRLDRDGLEATRLRIQRTLNDLSEEAEDWAVSGRTIKGEQPFVRGRSCTQLTFPEVKKDSIRVQVKPAYEQYMPSQSNNRHEKQKTVEQKTEERLAKSA